jgi:hypothetical protein
VAIARSLADQTFVRCTLVELHSAKVGEQHDPRLPSTALQLSSGCNRQTMQVYLQIDCMQVKVVSVKTDLRYWPCWQLSLDRATGEWRREVLSNADPKTPKAASS